MSALLPNKYTICVLISGRGSNLHSLLLSAKHYVVSAVVSSNPTAAGLAFADEFGVKKLAFLRQDYGSAHAHKQAIYQSVRDLGPDLIALAGFMHIVDPEFVAEFFGRIINIHPSLLPKLPGLNTHQRAIDAGEKSHGCTVHFVDSGVDTGPIIAQAAVAVSPDDSADSLALKVLEREHQLYPWVVNHLAFGNCRLSDGRVEWSSEMLKDAAVNNFIIPKR